jgi:hypothetical protein
VYARQWEMQGDHGTAVEMRATADGIYREMLGALSAGRTRRLLGYWGVRLGAWATGLGR